MICDGEKKIAAGFARLFFSKDANATQVELVAEAKEDLSILTGTLRPVSGCFDFHALCLSGERIHAQMRGLKCISYRAGTNSRVWRFGPAEFTISPSDICISDDEVAKMGSRLYAAVSPIWQSIFNLKSETTSIGIVERSGGATDWTELRIGQTHYRLGEAKGNSSLLFIDTSDHQSLEQLNRRLHSFLRALGFLLGGRIEAYGADARQGKILVTTLDEVARRRSPHMFSLPLVRFDFNQKENLLFLETATNYFFDHPDSPLFEYFDEFWGAELLSWRNRQRTLGIVIEGLANHILDDVVERADKPAWESFKKGKKQFKLSRAKILTLLDESELSKLKSTEFDRLRHVVNTCQPRVAVDSIRLAGELIGIVISEKELDGWRRMRNPAAHGRNTSSLTPDEEGEDLFLSLSILHKLALKLIGWTGDYIDYTKTPIRRASLPLLASSANETESLSPPSVTDSE